MLKSVLKNFVFMDYISVFLTDTLCCFFPVFRVLTCFTFSVGLDVGSHVPIGKQNFCHRRTFLSVKFLDILNLYFDVKASFTHPVCVLIGYSCYILGLGGLKLKEYVKGWRIPLQKGLN